MSTQPLFYAQQQINDGPMGPEFGKAAPIGLFVILALLAVVLILGVLMNKRIRRMERRRAFADQHGIDLFDTQRLEQAMREAGYAETAQGGVMFARTEVPQTDERFEPASGILTGPEALDAQSSLEKKTQGANTIQRDTSASHGHTPQEQNKATGGHNSGAHKEQSAYESEGSQEPHTGVWQSDSNNKHPGKD